jgi:hypothetical protein
MIPMVSNSHANGDSNGDANCDSNGDSIVAAISAMKI